MISKTATEDIYLHTTTINSKKNLVKNGSKNKNSTYISNMQNCRILALFRPLFEIK